MINRWNEDIQRLRAAKPKHILFMCVANSARSQLAEAIARHYAHELKVSSAGSAPSAVRPEVAIVLDEIKISSAGQYSKGLDKIEIASVDAVITLCAEEVCPVFPGNAIRLHWPLPDPARVVENANARLIAFRDVRDELVLRLRKLFE